MKGPYGGVLRALIALLSFLLLAASGWGEEPPLRFGVVPQQSAHRLASQWGPLLALLGERIGRTVRFETAADIPTFEHRLQAGVYDFAYMNPYQYTVLHLNPGYRAFARARGRRIRGILVVPKGSSLRAIHDLEGAEIALPSAAAFGASLLNRAELDRREVSYTPIFVNSHDSVYRGVAAGLYAAGGGVMRTFDAARPGVAEQLEIIWTSPSYTSHAVAAHPRVPSSVVTSLAEALVGLDEDVQGRALLEPLRIVGWQAAVDGDWDDVRSLEIVAELGLGAKD